MPSHAMPSCPIDFVISCIENSKARRATLARPFEWPIVTCKGLKVEILVDEVRPLGVEDMFIDVFSSW